MRYVILLMPLLTGCAALSDPAVVAEASAQAEPFRDVGEASGLPFAGPAAYFIAFGLGLLIQGRKKGRGK